MKLDSHPTAEQIISYVKAHYPNIATGTIYKVLDSFVEKNLLQKVKTDQGIMRFDPTLSMHHHLYCAETNRIEDFKDENLDEMIRQYLLNKGIENFQIKDFKLEINGTFINSKKHE